ncbi:hypothetical protein [Flavobacterium micromati]|uniref:hypothetical protein n=1 Tax=Flavobacterium micromati TaxID=229205 RepID=UPI0011149075|nr:hypothetical protein [Flavobacterium micromati]
MTKIGCNILLLYIIKPITTKEKIKIKKTKCMYPIEGIPFEYISTLDSIDLNAVTEEKNVLMTR